MRIFFALPLAATIFQLPGLVDARAASGRVDIVVNSLVYPEIAAEVDRLRNDVTAEGYTVAVRTWSTADGGAQALWTWLKSEYTGAGLKGAIFVGQLPYVWISAAETGPGDTAYWSLAGAYGDVSPGNYRIWVSRMHCEPTDYNSSIKDYGE